LKRRVAVLLLALTLTPASRPLLADEGARFVVVVNASNEVSEMSQDLVARIFLRKVRAWRGGRPAVPVDLSLASPLRWSFSRKVLRFSVGEVRDYWMSVATTPGSSTPAGAGSLHAQPAGSAAASGA
jgi:hypothetical protein